MSSLNGTVKTLVANTSLTAKQAQLLNPAGTLASARAADSTKSSGGVKLTAAKVALFKVKDGFESGGKTSAIKGSIKFDPQTQPLSTGEVPDIPRGALDQLNAWDRELVENAARGRGGGEAQQNLRTLVESKGFTAMDASTQAKVLQTFVAASPSSAVAGKQLASLLESANFSALSADDKSKVLDIFQKTSTTGRNHLVDLTNRTFLNMFDVLRRAINPKGHAGHSALLDKDKDGRTLLDNLHAMATGKLAPALEEQGISRASLLSSVMQEAGKPGEINQSSRGTCTVTSMQYMLCKEDPAEYVRLMRGLTSPSGTVKMRNGDTLKREEDSIAKDDATGRSDSERLFQAAMMEYSNGKLDYSNLTDKSTGKNVSRGGLNAAEQERGLQALFGRDFDQLNSGGLTGALAIEVLKKASGHRLLMDLKWGKNGGHAVTFVKIEGDRVYFRNPWGPTNDAKGTTYENPPRRLEDPDTRMESMSLKDFKKAFKRVYLPD
ncbi:MAG TPA: hypothetical protein VNA24_06975 [Hyalangium sp.]|nr:hypothetical protein [Hyalangium sp.]